MFLQFDLTNTCRISIREIHLAHGRGLEYRLKRTERSKIKSLPLTEATITCGSNIGAIEVRVTALIQEDP